jgi:catechol 2,3-dioxygenase-like lactoylglutathione lyase family enzyme
MAIAKLDHYTIKTADLEATKRFYIEVLQMTTGPRPDFDFPGIWLYAGENDANFPVVHVIGVDRDDPDWVRGTGAVDHIAFLATDWSSMKERCAAHGVDYKQRVSPALGLFQVFLRDPCGVTVELNYPVEEAGAA